MNCNEYLYHYTNVSALALILKNKSIRFSSLPMLDDLQEQEIKDEQRYGKYCFVSSWTDDETESIPMWKMYSDLSNGVRIKLVKYPFREYLINERNTPELRSLEDINDSTSSLFPASIFNKDYWPIIISQKSILHKVKYTNNPDELVPKIKSIIDGNTDFAFGKLGTCKNKHWAFQYEWRYILHFLPFGFREMYGSASTGSNQKSLESLDKCPDLPFSNYYLDLKEDATSQMELTLSPKIHDGNKHIIETLVKEHDSAIKILPSSLTGKIQ
ncbi:MAG: DUF2971 domain-containing protein [Defluviitaleaceae bacterium]|nr:DUF2971 domain-containing protein [Defluviitaleaceae bacterium]